MLHQNRRYFLLLLSHCATCDVDGILYDDDDGDGDSSRW